jgi:hypothetical protein
LKYVVCPDKITSPWADPNVPPYMPPNVPCAVKCRVVKEGPVMQFKCGRGHSFMATPEDVRQDG